METVEFAPGRNADLYGEPSRPTVLLWHGMQTDARASVGVLAQLIAGHGLHVVASDWNSHADDRGRSDLLASLDFARGSGSDPLVLVGWSMGGLAAADLTVHAHRLEIDLTHTVCLAGAFMAAGPISGLHVTDSLSTEEIRTPFTLLHGAADDVVPPSASTEFGEALRAASWPVEVAMLDADHASIAGAALDPTADRYVPATDGATREVAAGVAARIAAVIGVRND
ncbi:MAG: esterase [Mycobacterium sp.]|nr:esterase [Mycobacterium sp.]